MEQAGDVDGGRVGWTTLGIDATGMADATEIQLVQPPMEGAGAYVSVPVPVPPPCSPACSLLRVWLLRHAAECLPGRAGYASVGRGVVW